MSFFYRRIHGVFTGTSLFATRNYFISSRISLLSLRTFKAETSAKKNRVNPESVINEFTKVRDLRKMVDMFKWHSRDFRFRQLPEVYHEIIRRLVVAKKFSWVEEILEHQKRYPCIAREEFISRIMSLYGEAGMFDHARKLFDQFPDFRCRRTTMSFNCLLDVCIASKNSSQVIEIFRDLPEKLNITPNLTSYNTVCRAYLEMGSCNLIISTWEEMKNKCIEPDSLTYSILLDGLYQNGRISEAEIIWETMKIKLIKPCINCYNSELRLFVSQGNMVTAIYIFQRLRSLQIRPDRLTFYLMFKLYHKSNNMEEREKIWYDAKKLYVTLPKVKVTADSRICETLILFGTEMGDWDFVFELSLIAISRFIFIQKVPLQGVVDLLVLKSKLKQAKQLVDSIQECNDFYGYQLMLPLNEQQ